MLNILLADSLAPEAIAWLVQRHSVQVNPGLAELDVDGLHDSLRDVRAAVLPRELMVTRDLLALAPTLRVIARTHAGTDNTDLEACRAHGVQVIQVGSASVRSNAEYLLGALLLLLRPGMVLTIAGQRHAERRMGRDLNGSVVGLLGLSATGKALAPLLQAMGVRLIGYDPAIHSSAPVWRELGVRPVALPDLVAQADAVSIQMVYASRYCGFVNDKVLATCKPGQIWVGVSRSQIFDVQALAQALADGRIEACMLDGAEAGFAMQGSPLHAASNLYLTPRIGTHTRQAWLRASWYIAHRLHETLSVTHPGAAVAPASAAASG